MQMTLSGFSALLGAMLVLAAVPSVSVLTVAGRAASLGFAHGALVTAGVVAGDVALILVALYGLAFLADALGPYFTWLTHLGGIYLMALGVQLLRATMRRAPDIAETRPSLMSSFLLGLAITLADQKAILFYLGFLPAFLDVSRTTTPDTLSIIAAATFAITVPKLTYAFLAQRTGAVLERAGTGKALRTAAAMVLILAGGLLLIRG